MLSYEYYCWSKELKDLIKAKRNWKYNEDKNLMKVGSAISKIVKQNDFKIVQIEALWWKEILKNKMQKAVPRDLNI